MGEAAVVLRRELRSYFLSPIAYVFGGLFLGLQAFFATGLLLQPNQYASMQRFFELLPQLLLVFVPALTMRLWAEERKQGTLELLMTFPVTIGQLIAGKFLAALAYLSVLLLFTLGIPITMSLFGALDWPPVAMQYCASLLMAAAYLSVGMFWSSTTRDQIVALLLSLVSLLVLYFMASPVFLDAVASWLPAAVRDALVAVSPYRYFVSIARGVLDTRDLLYYAAFCGFFLYANALVLQARRRRG